MARLVLIILCASMIAGRVYLAHEPRAASAVVDEAPHARSSLRLLTWNVGYADVEADSRARLGDMRGVARVIQRSGADVVALQELTGRAQLDAILAVLGDGWSGHLATGGRTDRHPAVLTRHAASFSDVTCGHRRAAVARLDTGGTAIVLASGHAPAYSARGRRAFVDDLAAWGGRDRAHTFFAGDFNLDVTPVAGANSFTDDAKRDGESYSQLVDGWRDLGKLAGPTADAGRRIDYIFGPRDVRLRSARVLAGAGLGRMDHRPLVVEVAL